MNAHPTDLIALIDYRMALVDSISAACLARKVRRLEKLSARARRGVASKHRERMEAATALRGVSA